MVKISVIIPIFNTEKHLEKCLESVRTQTFNGFEVIMVDDGSTDSSAIICKDYEKKDSRFRYFYKKNGGSSSARNCGIKNAKGDYIAFIDSDDYIEPDYLETLAAHSSESYDIIQCGMRLIRNDSITTLVPEDKAYMGNEYACEILKRKIPIFLFQSSVTKLYRRALLSKNNITFNPDIAKSEDCLFNTELLPHIRTVKTISMAKYNYLQDNSYLSKAKTTFDKVLQSIKVGCLTAKIRNDVIQQYGWEDDIEIQKGFQTAICIIYISNAHEIETGGFSKEEKQKLYASYFLVMDYPIDLAVNDFEGTDRKIAFTSFRKDSKAISRIYKLRATKKKIRSIIGR